ncbi:hypothetical protein BGW80DRAFT_582745 [Lactifluus volemus]|nr:hypothetical protein BGW80DRAFT_582745 [Lactifluus volemus]
MVVMSCHVTPHLPFMPVARRYNASSRASLNINPFLTSSSLPNYMMAKHLPSAQARRGDYDLENAHDLRDQWKGVIPSDDMGSIQNRILMTSNMKVGLDSKRDIPKIMRGRIVDMQKRHSASSRARDAEFFGSSHDTQRAAPTHHAPFSVWEREWEPWFSCLHIVFLL